MKNLFLLIVAMSMCSCEPGEEPQPETPEVEGRWMVYFEEHELCRTSSAECTIKSLEEPETFFIQEMLFTGDSAFFYNYFAEDSLYGQFSYEFYQDTVRIGPGDQTEQFGIFAMDRKSDQTVTFTNAFYNQDSSFYFVDVYHVRRP